MSQPDSQPDSQLEAESSRVALVTALRSAFQARLGVPPGMEPVVRQYGRALRVSGMPIEKAVVFVKELVRSETRGDEAVFVAKLVGWVIAGYFAGTEPRPPRSGE